ncbi:MAG TPA: small ribosomal subunit Rsm22 family protein [Candidatus Angelobacter sp.]
MRLPEELLAAIQREAEKLDRAALTRATAELTRRYKAATFSGPIIQSDAQRVAYLAARLPATYAANWRVFSEINRLTLHGQTEIASVLDLGAGPGASLWAAAETFPGLRQATLVESDEAWLKLGRRIAEHSAHSFLRQAQWIRQDLRTPLACSAHDLVVISYALGELSPAAANALLLRAWELAAGFLVVIEPGTPRGFGVVHAARSALIAHAAGAGILAPCPHRDECPLAAAGDWCHFAQRVPRTSLHRRLKSGALAYEDEKFSYVVASRQNAMAASARIVRHPQKRSGHVQLTLCARSGIEKRIISRSQGKDYQLARRAEWGEAWAE